MGKVKQFKAAFCCVLALIMSMKQSPLVFAQSSVDTHAPIIELVPMAEAEADDVQVFTVQAADDEILKDVILYYRRDGQLPYLPAPMNQIGSSGYYAATVETDRNDLRSIQYYIQARDESGNRTVEGFAFDPYIRSLNENNAYAAQQSLAIKSTPTVPATETAATASGIKWWHLALGVLAVGAIASSVGGDGNGDNDNNLVPLTINLTGL